MYVQTYVPTVWLIFTQLLSDAEAYYWKKKRNKSLMLNTQAHVKCHGVQQKIM